MCNSSLLAVSNGATVDARWLSARVRARLGARDARGGATADGWGRSCNSNGLCSASSGVSSGSLRTGRTARSWKSWRSRWSLVAVQTGFAVFALDVNCNVIIPFDSP